ncbi:methyltransferase domain-containing protein [Hyphobacterium sp. HN65]|uniref:Methyltransferase domain-containing protein n=1 Tax=Hyphobacterium lacteum TaxID=3116575 RepID=A0ABU7LN98_9PROT|nr:methyltransferase domain-containing protein [Hyphobacterium sp. HN65]MEE2525395.1 methyltransferase domain-containing protein [Hyphobacterium sp. HN65]
MSQQALPEDDYIIGASQREVSRLGQQHAIWRERALAAWRRAGLKPGMSVLDMGCGPGHASFDLAQLVGPSGEVIAVDQSELFLEAVEAGARARGLTNIRTMKADLAEFELPAKAVDFIWTRWVMSFLSAPQDLITRLGPALRPGGVFVAHEYGDYTTFGLHPRHETLDRFIDAVQASWRAFGGEPDIAKQLPEICASVGWKTEYMTPHVFTTRPGEMVWEWPIGWLKSDGIDRLVELGFFSAEDAERFHAFVDERCADPMSILTTPMVIEVIARKGTD